MHIDAAVEGVQRTAQRHLRELLARDHAAGVAQQKLQHIELDGGEIDRHIAAGDGARRHRHVDVADGERLIMTLGRDRLARAAKDGANACDQFARIERLGQVIVGTDLEAQNAIHGLAARSEQKHRHGRLLTQRLQQLEARTAGQHDIQDDEFVLTGERRAQAGSVVVGRFHAKAFSLQEALQQVD